MKLGTRVRFNEKSVWPERVGCEGVVVDEAIFEGKYPADHRRNTHAEVIVKLDNDPLVEPGHRLQLWTCSTDIDSLDVL